MCTHTHTHTHTLTHTHCVCLQNCTYEEKFQYKLYLQGECVLGGTPPNAMPAKTYFFTLRSNVQKFHQPPPNSRQKKSAECAGARVCIGVYTLKLPLL